MSKQTQPDYSLHGGFSPNPTAPFLQSKRASDHDAFDTLMMLITSSAGFDLNHASEIAKSAIMRDPNLEWRLIRYATHEKGSADEVIRIIRIFECVCSKVRLLSHLLSLDSVAHPRVRSKVALTIGRLVQNTAWLREQLQVPEPRVRANAVEALWGVRVEGAESLLLEATSDANNRVIGNAAYGLYRLGNVKAVSTLYSLLRRPEKLFRNTALWAITQTGDPRFLQSLQSVPTNYLEEDDERQWRERAYQYLLARLQASQFAGKLALNLSTFKRSANYLRIAGLFCLSSEAGIWFGSEHLNALNFIIEEDGRQVEEFECRWIVPAQAISSVVIAPASLSAHGRALSMFSSQASKDELVSIVSYLPSFTVLTRDNKDWLAENQDSKVSSNIGVHRFSAINDFHEAVTKGLEILSNSTGERHLFIVVDSTCQGKLPSSVTKLVKASGSTVHVLASTAANSEPAEMLTGISQKSGGVFLRTESADLLPEMARSVRARHSSSFELSWKGFERLPKEVKIKCVSGCGFGEITVPQ